MFKNMARAIRRHHKARLKKNRKNYWGFGKYGWRGSVTSSLYEEMDETCSGIVINTPTPCSCWMCRNPRHSDWLSKKSKLTMAERRMLDNYKNDIREV